MFAAHDARAVYNFYLGSFDLLCPEETEISRRLTAVEDQILAVVPISAADAAVHLRLLH